MSRDDAYLVDALASARLALQYLRARTEDSFNADVYARDAVIRRLLVVGEAAPRLSCETRDRHRHIPWGQIIAMRNVMVHEYDDIDPHIVWDTVCRLMPPLIADLERIVPPPS